MAATIVSGITVFSDASGHGNQSHFVYAPVQQRWWLFYIDTKTATTVKTMVSSSNDLTTATWSAGSASSAFPSSRALSSNDQRNLGVALVPNSTNANDAVHVSVGICAAGNSTTSFIEHVRAKFTSTASITWETWSELSIAMGNAASTISAIKGNALGVSTTGVVHESSVCGITGEDANARLASNADTASAWTNAFGAMRTVDASMANAVNAYALAPLASAAMLLVYDDGGTTEPSNTGLRYNKYGSGTTWPTTGSAATGNGTTSQDQNDWCLCAVDTTHVYTFRRTSTGVDCRLFNGTAWSTPTSTIPANTSKAGSGVFAATDGTALWLFQIDSAGNGAIKYVKGSTATGTISFDGSWTTLDIAGSTARNFISGNPTVSNNQIGVIYTAVNSTNFDIGLSTLSLSSAFNSTITESASATDTDSAVATYVSSLTESASATDTDTGAGSYASSQTETASATDSVSATVTYAVTVSETVTTTDTETAVATYVSTDTESATASDSNSALAIYAAARTESAAASDTETAIAAYATTDTETITASDVETATATYVAAQTETVAATDADTATATYIAARVESAAATDAQTAAVAGATTVVETAAATDTETATATYMASDLETATLSDAASATSTTGSSQNAKTAFMLATLW